MEMIKTFAKSESGAVTVDWVVLTAAIVGLGLAVMAVVSGGVEDLAGDIDTQLTGMGHSTPRAVERFGRAHCELKAASTGCGFFILRPGIFDFGPAPHRNSGPPEAASKDIFWSGMRPLHFGAFGRRHGSGGKGRGDIDT
jgi:Flp pilus assembly pilin Flp